jgi:hypothetical protein
MRKAVKDFWIAGMVTFIILGCFNIACANDGPKVLKVKGFYLGMPTEKAMALAAKLVGLCSKEDAFSYTCGPPHNPEVLSTVIRFTAKHNKVIRFEFMFASELFGAEEWSFDKFVQTFIDAYKIPSMEGKRVGRSGRVYSFQSTKYGYMLSLDSWMSVIVEQVTTDKFN